MDVAGNRVGRIAGFIHHNLLWVLIGSYALAAVLPGPGLWLEAIHAALITPKPMAWLLPAARRALGRTPH